jgi:hypothetical protein
MQVSNYTADLNHCQENYANSYPRGKYKCHQFLEYRPLPIQAAGDKRIAKVFDYVGFDRLRFRSKIQEINHKHSYSAICQTHLCIITVNVSSLSIQNARLIQWI